MNRASGIPSSCYDQFLRYKALVEEPLSRIEVESPHGKGVISHYPPGKINFEVSRFNNPSFGLYNNEVVTTGIRFADDKVTDAFVKTGPWTVQPTEVHWKRLQENIFQFFNSVFS